MKLEPEDVLFSERVIFLTNSIDVHSVTYTIQQLLTLANDDPNKNILLCINNYGGGVSDAFSLINVMEAIKPEVYTLAYGCVFSAASLVYAAGDYRYSLPSSVFMIHLPVMSFEDVTLNTTSSIMNVCKFEEERMVRLYQEASDFSRDEIFSHGDNYFKAPYGKKRGFVDKIIKTLPAKLSTLLKPQQARETYGKHIIGA